MTQEELKYLWESIIFDTENKILFSTENAETIGNYEINDGILLIKVLKEYLTNDKWINEIIENKIIEHGIDDDYNYEIKKIVLKENIL
ncbi:hypothetical protein [Apibacter adventoris]|uniref:Uncharacterized protein n=1 Tax=Apibacter adventoris TaxID=1679466 RepID=A0A2S8AAP2_9FLAO|nr:hypothetical protein [Apibacter adventoris]PQL91668.1 hypothetical protein C4S77_07655 [Apibacter adventoris]